MSRNSSGGLGLILIIMFLVGSAVLAGAILLWPLYNLYKYISARIKASTFLKELGENPEPNLFYKLSVSNDDKMRLYELGNSASEGMESLKDLQTQLANLGTLTKNKDGSYSQRSAAGKQAFKISQEISSYTYSLHKIENEIHSILNKPKKMWGAWKTCMVQYRANKNALLVMLFLFPVLFYLLGRIADQNFIYGMKLYLYASFILPSQILGDITSLYIVPLTELNDFGEPFKQGFVWQTWAIAMLPVPIMTYIFYKVSKARFSAIIDKSTPEPEEYSPEKSY